MKGLAEQEKSPIDLKRRLSQHENYQKHPKWNIIFSDNFAGQAGAQIFNDLEILQKGPDFFKYHKLHRLQFWYSKSQGLTGFQQHFIDIRTGQEISAGKHCAYCQFPKEVTLQLELDEYITDIQGMHSNQQVEQLFLLTNLGKYVEIKCKTKSQKHQTFRFKLGAGNTVGCFIVGIGMFLESFSLLQIPIQKMPLIPQERPILHKEPKIVPFIIYKSNMYGGTDESNCNWFDDFEKFNMQPFVKDKKVRISEINVFHNQKILGIEIHYIVNGKKQINYTNTKLLTQKLEEITYTISQLKIDEDDSLIAIQGCTEDENISSMTLQTKKGLVKSFGVQSSQAEAWGIELPFTYKYLKRHQSENAEIQKIMQNKSKRIEEEQQKYQSVYPQNEEKLQESEVIAFAGNFASYGFVNMQIYYVSESHQQNDWQLL